MVLIKSFLVFVIFLEFKFMDIVNMFILSVIVNINILNKLIKFE